jgi:hypothetical protein
MVWPAHSGTVTDALVTELSTVGATAACVSPGLGAKLGVKVRVTVVVAVVVAVEVSVRVGVGMAVGVLMNVAVMVGEGTPALSGGRLRAKSTANTTSIAATAPITAYPFGSEVLRLEGCTRRR